MSIQREYAVYGIGNAIVDLQIRAEDGDLEKLCLQKSTMKLVDVLEQKKAIEYFHGLDINCASGGSAANTIIALAQLSLPVSYGCLVAADKFGLGYLSELKELSVVVRNKPVEDEITGTSLIVITPDAERTMQTNLGISAKFSPEQVDEELIRKSQWIYIEGYLFATQEGRAAVRKAVASAKLSQTKVALTFSDTFIVHSFRDFLLEILQDTDLVFANIAEAKSFVGVTNEDDVFSFLRENVSNIVVTLSERGARGVWNGEEFDVQAVKVELVDLTGAGDMFAAGFLYGVLKGVNPREAGRIGCLLASKVISQLGPRLNGDLTKYI